MLKHTARTTESFPCRVQLKYFLPDDASLLTGDTAWIKHCNVKKKKKYKERIVSFTCQFNKQIVDESLSINVYLFWKHN